MTREEFEARVNMVVEIECEVGGRYREVMTGNKVKAYLDNLADDEYFSDCDFACEQEPEIRHILDIAYETLKKEEIHSLDEALDYYFENTNAPKPEKKVWTAEEIGHLVQTNDVVLYRALKKLYGCQTDSEKENGRTHSVNGVGFNKYDSGFLSSVAEFLIRKGYLTDRQKIAVRKKLVKYTKQLTALANA